jgi:large subunit ribosomal protein L17
MRHRKASLKLNRTTSHRLAMFRNMVTSLFKHERIRTTSPKAKELRRLADHIITLAKRGDLHARRQALAVIREKDVVHKLFDEANEKFGHSAGGYTRIVKLGRRAGDAAPMSLIELIVPEAGGKKKAKKKTAKAQAAKAKAGSVKKTDAKTQDEKKPAKKKAAADEKKKPKTKKKEASAQKEETAKPKKAAAKKGESKTKSASVGKKQDSADKPKKASKKKSSKEEKKA